MSDYVDNDQQDGFESFDMDFGQPTMAEEFDWNDLDHNTLANIDWMALHEEIKEVVFEDPAEEMQPGDRRSGWGEVTSFVQPLLSPDESMPPPFRSVVIPNEVATFACQEPGCRSQPFKRIGDLNRHNRKHSDSAVRFHCPASGCRRKGKQGFSRRDKLTDHMLAGHNEDDWFSCASCGVQFERAEYQFHDETARLQYNRTCPMPRCSFKVFTGHDEDQELKLEMLQEHLLAKHDLKARSNFSELLGRRGYEARSGEIICPVCSPPCLFKNHGDFEGHFMHTHFQGTVFSRHEDGSCEATCFGYNAYRSLAECTSIPEEVRQHRLAILRIMPVFADFPVWDDITPCSGRA